MRSEDMVNNAHQSPKYPYRTSDSSKLQEVSEFVFSTTLRNRPNSYQIRQITQTTQPLHRSRSFKVTDFGTNRKPICDLLLVINRTYLLSCAVSKLWPIIGRIFACDRGVPHFNASAVVILCEFPDKLFLSRN